MKIYTLINAPGKIRALWDFTVTVHLGNTEGRRSVVLNESALHTVYLVKIMAISLFISTSIFVLNPVYAYFWKHENILLVNLYLPNINAFSPRGYRWTMIYQFFVAPYAIFGNTGYDLFLAMFVSNYIGIVSIWQCQLDDLVEINRRKKTPQNQAYRRLFLRNIYIQLLDAFE